MTDWTVPEFDPENHPTHGSSRLIKKGPSFNSLEELSLTGSLNFGDVAIGTSLSLPCEFINTGTRVLTGITYSFPNGFSYIGTIPSRLRVDDSFTILIKCTPETVGDLSNNLLFNTLHDAFEFPCIASGVLGTLTYNDVAMYNGVHTHNGIL